METPPPRRKPMPHVKQRCHRCRGSGRAPCQICGGTGQVAKGKDAHGNTRFDRCDGCLGLRTRRCAVCGGEGFA